MSSTAGNICKTISEVNNNDDVCVVNDMLQNMSTGDKDNNDVSVCANCGKAGANNICNKCKQVKYCNAVCKKVHKKKHKKDCDENVRLAAEKHNEELRIAAELHGEELFRQAPPPEDCPICFLRMPILNMGVYKSCCGKEICSGCAFAPVYDNQGNKVDKVCPFCRTQTPKSDEEVLKRIMKRVEVNDEKAIYSLGTFYRYGINGMPQDYIKALELFHRAAELGCVKAYNKIGYAYDVGEGVEVDKKKAIHYYELGAMGGDETARYNLGFEEVMNNNMDRALKHHLIAIKGGHDLSLKMMQDLYSNGHVTKGDYTTALQSYQKYLDEIKSVQRDKAAAADDNYRYY